MTPTGRPVDKFAQHREIFAQIVRYGLTGGFVTALYAAIYALVARIHLPLPPNLHLQAANLAGYLVAVAIGYFLHSAFSFRGHGTRDNHARSGGRFFLASLLSLAINAGWTWLLVARLGWEKHTPLLPICFVTPALLFWVNRKWVFR